jgi:hypothetical protein
MTRNKVALAVGLGLVALLALTPLAEAKIGKGAAPNLVVTKVSKPPAGAIVGSKLKLVVKVRNKGAGRAGKSKLALYLAKGTKHRSKDKRLKRVKLRSLGSGTVAKVKLKPTLPGKTAPGIYRLIACADDAKKLHELKERDNCAATRKFSVTASGVPTPPAAPGAPAFTMTDGLDWGFTQDAQRVSPDAGDPVTVTLRAANGLPGQAGYTRADVAPEGFLAGATTTFDFGSQEDDGEVTVELPFAFPFGGISENTVSVGTNGWISFGSPALDYWDDDQPYDYRGPGYVVAELDRGIMPYWNDLDVSDRGAGAGTVQQVVAVDGSAVAFQWDTGQRTSNGEPRRAFQVVLYRDGRFRLDYPGTNASGGQPSFIGYSLGTGAGGSEAVATGVDSVPTGSLLFTPKPVSAGSALATGQATLTLPVGSAFLSGGPGCAAVTAPGPFSRGLASCPIPALAGGQQAAQTITFAMPPDAPGESTPANFRLLGSYLSGSSQLADADEIDSISTNLEATDIAVLASYAGPPTPATGAEAEFAVTIFATNSSLDEPTASFDLPPDTTLNSVEIGGQPIACGAVSAGHVTCQLPSGISSTQVTVRITPSAAAKGSTLTLGATAQALNAPAASGSATSPTVVEGA